MDKVRILYDGWPIVRRPYSPAALHLRALLAYLPPQVEGIVALPEQISGAMERARAHIHPTPDNTTAHLKWEQLILPRLAGRLGAQLIHLTSLGAPLFGRAISVVSPGDFETPAGQQAGPQKDARSLPARLRAALARGGLARARAIFWPADLPEPALPMLLFNLPPVVHPSFTPSAEFEPRLQAAQPSPPGIHPNGSNNGGQPFEAAWERTTDLPEDYVLYHGPAGRQDLLQLLEAWSWAAGPVGSSYPLLLLGLDGEQRWELAALLAEFDFGDAVRALPDAPVEALPAIYRNCKVLFHPARLPPWGGPVRLALASGKPVVAAETPSADAIVGPAAYLAPLAEARALGAALLTVIVEEEVAEKLAKAARERSASWRDPGFGNELAAAYRTLLNA